VPSSLIVELSHKRDRPRLFYCS